MPKDEVLISTKSLSFGYGSEDDIFSGLELSIKRGETVGLVGPSGCGKTTLLNILGGLLKPKKGTVFLHKNSAVPKIDISGEKGHCSYMFQDHTLLPWRTVIKNVLLPTEIKPAGIECSEIKPEEKVKQEMERADSLLHTFGIADSRNQYPHQLSGGMKQRAAFARTFMAERDAYIFDEPFSGVDFVRQLSLERMLNNFLDSNGHTCILVSHDIEATVALSDRLLVFPKPPVKDFLEIKTGLGSEWSDPVDARECKSFGSTIAQIVEHLREYIR